MRIGSRSRRAGSCVGDNAIGGCRGRGIHGRRATPHFVLVSILASLDESRADVERNLVLPEVLTCPPWIPATGQAELAC